jgi:hypothetical protein
VATCASDSGHREVAVAACDAWRAVRGMHSKWKKVPGKWVHSRREADKRLTGGPHVEEHLDLNKPEIKS